MRFFEGEFYHIYNRGVDGRNIFQDKADYERFLKSLAAFNVDLPIEIRFHKNPDSEIRSPSDNLTSIIAYALMQNHVHLLFRCIDSNKLSQYLQKLFIGYTMYFNKKYERKGVLFQGRSKSKHVNSDRYLNHLVDYIHLNPLDYSFPQWRANAILNPSKAKRELLKYPWSSIHGFLSKSDPVLDQDLIKELFPTPHSVLNSALEWSAETLSSNPDLFLEP